MRKTEIRTGLLMRPARARRDSQRAGVAALLGRELSDAEWHSACTLLELIASHPDGESLAERCIERGLSVQETIKQLSGSRLKHHDADRSASDLEDTVE